MIIDIDILYIYNKNRFYDDSKMISNKTEHVQTSYKSWTEKKIIECYTLKWDTLAM